MDTYNMFKKACDKAGLLRVKYIDNNIPTNPDNIVILPFFGDLRSSFILSKLILKRYRDQIKGSKYFIMVSWPGDEILYPYVDEYWTFKADSIEDFKNNALGFTNDHERYSFMMRALHYFFADVLDPAIFQEFYSNGLTTEFFNTFKEVMVFSPAILSSVSSLGIEVSKSIQISGPSVLITSSKKIRRWNHGETASLTAPKDFWVFLFKKLIKEGITPIVCLDEFSYDTSKEVSKCVYLNKLTTSQALTAMRSVGCVLDLFSGISRLAILAKTPYLGFDERNRFFGHKEYELDDLCAQKVPREYVFSFPAIISDGSPHDWDANIVSCIVNKLNIFLPSLNRDNWDTLSEKEEKAEYSGIRKKNMLKLGTKFIKVDQLNSD